jgi:hypothetical protein
MSATPDSPAPLAVEQLPPDQRALLSLLLAQGQRYHNVAQLLSIPEDAVRSRAHRALAALGGAPPAGLGDRDVERVGDYLLGQLSEGERIETLALLLDSGAASAWARGLAAGLAPLAKVALPEVPGEEGEPPARDRTPRRGTGSGPAGRGGAREPAGSPRPRAPLTRATIARAAVPLATAALVIAAVVVFAVRGTGSSAPPAGPITASAASASAGTASGTSVIGEVALRPTASGSHAAGVAAIISTGSGSGRDLAFSAQNLPAPPAGAHYVLWLYDSPSHFQALGEISSVKNGSVSPVGVALPSDASSFHGVVLTLETSGAPSAPSAPVLEGTSNSPL